LTRLLPRSLFGQTSLTLSIALILFLVLVIGATLRYILLPVAERSTEDLAALMVLSAQTWAELPPVTRADFERELQSSHQLYLTAVEERNAPPLNNSAVPYVVLLRDALETRLRNRVPAGTLADQSGWYWFDIPMAGRILRIGFNGTRLAGRAPTAVFIIFVVGALFILLTSSLLVHRLTKPLAGLAASVEQVGAGRFPAPIAERGPREIASLGAGFNQMVAKLKRLMASRTVLLAGVSHDMRTPLTHLSLVVEMLPDDLDPRLRHQMQRDLVEMNRLIAQIMELSRGLDRQDMNRCEFPRFVYDLIADYRLSPADIILTGKGECTLRLSTTALRRILTNLLDNAIRYREGMPIALDVHCSAQCVRIIVSDQGPGIPPALREKVFEPFYRIEESRNRQTGGSGLGLAIVSQLAEVNHWRVSLERNQAGGTDAILEIPRGAASSCP
jgi:two-component system osmolarity sensor histidine kinase EnvZ